MTTTFTLRQTLTALTPVTRTVAPVGAVGPWLRVASGNLEAHTAPESLTVAGARPTSHSNHGEEVEV